MVPGPIDLPIKYVLKTNVTLKSEGLGLTIGTSSITLTGLEVGRPFIVTVFLNANGVRNHTVGGSSMIAQATQSLQTASSTFPAFAWVGKATASSVSITFNVNIGSAHYLFSAYQV